MIGREADIASGEDQQLKPSLCNALMMAEPDADFANRWLEQSYSEFDGTWSKHSCQLAARLAEQHPDQLHIVPAPCFYKHMFTPEGIHTLFEGLDSDYSEVYSMHMWNHLWWDSRRTDFSTFHAGRLTEEYIRTTDTTYNLIARQYL